MHNFIRTEMECKIDDLKNLNIIKVFLLWPYNWLYLLIYDYIMTL